MNGSVSTILMFAAFIVLMYFMMIRPQKKQQQKRREMMSNLKKGDAVVTIGRLHGVIDSINPAEHTVTLDCDGIYLTFDQSAIGQVIPAESAVKSAPSAVEKTPEQKQPTETTDSETGKKEENNKE